MGLNGEENERQGLGDDEDGRRSVPLVGSELIPVSRGETQKDIKTGDGCRTDQEPPIEKRMESVERLQVVMDVIREPEQHQQSQQIGPVPELRQIEPEPEPSKGRHLRRQGRQDPALFQSDEGGNYRQYPRGGGICGNGRASRGSASLDKEGQANLHGCKGKGERLHRPVRLPVVLGEEGEEEKGGGAEDHNPLDDRSILLRMDARYEHVTVVAIGELWRKLRGFNFQKINRLQCWLLLCYPFQ